jgi:hypothetical protein
MQFVRLGEFLATAHISGITHNLLKIKVSQLDQGELICDRLPATGSCRHKPLDEYALVQSVQEGIAQANEKLGTSYTVSYIQYVENDTPPESIYAFMAMRIVEHLHAGGAWVAGGP